VDVFLPVLPILGMNRKNLETGANAAAAGGYTDVFLVPNTKPVTDNSRRQNISAGAQVCLLNLHPVGAVSKAQKGKIWQKCMICVPAALSLSAMASPGTIAGILLKALQYVKAFDGTIIQIPDDTV